MLGSKDSVGEGVGSPGWILGSALGFEVSCNVGLTLCTQDGPILGIGDCRCDGLVVPSKDGPVEGETKGTTEGLALGSAENNGAGVGSPGWILGPALGIEVSSNVGLTLRIQDGPILGIGDGCGDGLADPTTDGPVEGETKGTAEGLALGSLGNDGAGAGPPGLMLGPAFGRKVGSDDGLALGAHDGETLRTGDGSDDGLAGSPGDGLALAARDEE